MDDLKRCSKSKLNCLGTNFYKNGTMKDSLRISCKFCTNQCHYKNAEKRSLRETKRIAIDVNYPLIKNRRRRIHLALNGKSKPSSTKVNLGRDINTNKLWIEWQMTPETNWINIEIDHVKPICVFNISVDEEL